MRLYVKLCNRNGFYENHQIKGKQGFEYKVKAMNFIILIKCFINFINNFLNILCLS